MLIQKTLKKKWFLVLITLAALGCSSPPPPTDSAGNSPEATLKTAYELILAGDFADAEKHFDERLIKAVLPPTHPDDFTSFYKKQTENWKAERLQTELKGNDYNDNVWRVRIWSEEGRGKDNTPGAMQDLAQINGVWKIVFWGDYEKM